jgi:hypothetical protein
MVSLGINQEVKFILIVLKLRLSNYISNPRIKEEGVNIFVCLYIIVSSSFKSDNKNVNVLMRYNDNANQCLMLTCFFLSHLAVLSGIRS